MVWRADGAHPLFVNSAKHRRTCFSQGKTKILQGHGEMKSQPLKEYMVIFNIKIFLISY